MFRPFRVQPFEVGVDGAGVGVRSNEMRVNKYYNTVTKIIVFPQYQKPMKKSATTDIAWTVLIIAAFGLAVFANFN